MKRVRRGLVLDIFLIAAVLGVIAGALSLHSVRTQVKATVDRVTATPTPVSAYTMVVQGVKVDAVGARPYLPGKGRQYYIMDIKLKNTGREVMQIAPVVQMYIRDGSGNTYNMAPAPLTVPLAAGALATGEERQGQISFNIPQSATGLRLMFDPHPAKSQPSTYELGY